MKRVILCSLIVAAVAWRSAEATIINVPDDYPTIQAGINASSDGDTVLVHPGTYYEHVELETHKIILASLFLITGDNSYISSTIIDGYSSGFVIELYGGDWDTTTVIAGFTITNGTKGISCYRWSPKIHNNIITNNSYGCSSGTRGVGISCSNSDAEIFNNIITYNRIEDIGFTGEGRGAGIHAFNASTLKIHNNVIMRNTVSGEDLYSGDGKGAGIFWWGGPGGEISNNLIAENTVTARHAQGAGIYCSGADPQISQNIIIRNEASGSNIVLGGGIQCRYYSDPYIVNNTICGNSVSSGTGEGYGGGIAIRRNSSPTLINNIFRGNSAPVGNQIYVESSTPTITYCDIEGGWDGDGNIDIDPLFRDPENSDYHLMSTECDDPYDSPCIDVGNPFNLDSVLDCSWGLGGFFSDMGAYGGGDTAYFPDCVYIPGDVNHNGTSLELRDVTAMIDNYRGIEPPSYTCTCGADPPGPHFPATADPNGNCIANELVDVITEIRAYRGTGEVSGCPDCPGSRQLLPGNDNQPLSIPSLESKTRIKNGQ